MSDPHCATNGDWDPEDELVAPYSVGAVGPMSTDWKPGDVAMVTWVDDYDGDVQTTVRVMVSNGTTDDAPGQRRPAWWGGDGYLAAGMKGLSARPLVVIDPEDREQVERLYHLIDAAEDAPLDDSDDGTPFNADQWAINAVAVALREFANPTPPKPDEPQGLGAVVEAINDNRFVRVGALGWVHEADASGNPCDWDDIAVVRVISEGVRS